MVSLGVGWSCRLVSNGVGWYHSVSNGIVWYRLVSRGLYIPKVYAVVAVVYAGCGCIVYTKRIHWELDCIPRVDGGGSYIPEVVTVVGIVYFVYTSMIATGELGFDADIGDHSHPLKNPSHEARL